jgi:hypothetical protein
LPRSRIGRDMNVKSSKLVCALVFMLSTPALATTFVVPTDAQMVDRAEAIVRGTVISSVPSVDADGHVITTIRLTSDEVLKGQVDSIVEIVEQGGVTPEKSSWIYGTPRYSAGERVLVFLERDQQSRWHTSHMLLGKFAFVPAASGERLLLRGSDEHGVFGVTAEGEEHQELPRVEDKFLHFVASAAKGGKPVPDYYADPELQKAWEGRRLRVITDAGTDYAMTPAARWNNNATASIPTNLNGAPGSRDWVGAAQRGASAWNSDSGSNVNYNISGTSAATFSQGDGQNIIIFNVAPGEFGSAIGIGGWAGGGSHNFNGESWVTINEIDVKINANAVSASQGIIDAVLTHELGHTLGFRHSDQAGRTPNSTNAIMKAVLSGAGGATLQQWDRDALASVYGSGAPVCTPSSIVSGPNASPNPVTAGANTQLSVTAGGSAPLTYAWFRGTLGDTANPVGSSQSVNVGPINAQTTYWVRVTNSCNASGASAAVIVNLAACVAPTISSQPQNRSIIAGRSTTLSVTAGGTAPFTYQWFQGPAGNTSSPVAGGTTSTITVSPTSTTTYWVRVNNSCAGGTVNSNAATVTVGPCTPPTISNQPQSRGINPGQSTTLTVGVNGTDPFTFQWFRGQSGDTANPIPSSNSNSITVNPTATTSYWVRITNTCSTTPVNSATATVSINLPCTAAPAITQQPVAQTVDKGQTATLSVTATGGGLNYQWFQVTGGNFVQLPGATSSTFVTPPLTASTAYLVQVSNPCGPSANSQIVNVTVRPDAPPRRRAIRR